MLFQQEHERSTDRNIKIPVLASKSRFPTISYNGARVVGLVCMAGLIDPYYYGLGSAIGSRSFAGEFALADCSQALHGPKIHESVSCKHVDDMLLLVGHGQHATAVNTEKHLTFQLPRPITWASRDDARKHLSRVLQQMAAGRLQAP
jgi:hypothetical protein